MMQNKKGYSLVLVPIVLTMVLSLIALTFDFGRVLVLKHQLQSAVDAAAIAGASMVKIEFAVDADGKFQYNTTTKNLSEQKALTEADNYFDKNITAMQLEEKGISILESKGTVKDGQTFEYYAKAKIPVTLAAIFLGSEKAQNVTVIADAKTTDNE